MTSLGRRLSQRERLRLQGVADDSFAFDMSDASLGRAIGNMMSVNVVCAVLRHMLPILWDSLGKCNRDQLEKADAQPSVLRPAVCLLASSTIGRRDRLGKADGHSSIPRPNSFDDDCFSKRHVLIGTGLR